MALAAKLRKLIRALEPHWAWLYGRLAPPLNLDQAAPVLVLGNQKTGSSAVAHLLAACSDARLAANVHPAQGHERQVACFDRPRMRAFIQREGRYHFGHAVVKENALTLATGPLLDALPQARAVFVTRHPVHNIRSILDRLGLPGSPRPLRALAPGLPGGWREVMTGMAKDADDHITALARRWAALARVYLRHRQRLHLARYEDFMADKAGFVRRLAAELGLGCRRDLTALVDVSFQPRGAHRGVPPQQFFAPEALRTIGTCCAREMRALRYDPITPSAPAS